MPAPRTPHPPGAQEFFGTPPSLVFRTTDDLFFPSNLANPPMEPTPPNFFWVPYHPGIYFSGATHVAVELFI
jgi:hypothetical protein